MRRIKVLTNLAHCGHQYELWKLPIDVSIIIGVGHPNYDHWRYGMRPFPKNAKFINYKEVNTKEYDLVIAHFDENALSPRHPSLNDEWGKTFRWIMENIKDIPIIGVCHGNPQFEEQGLIEKNTTEVTRYIDRREQMVAYMGNNIVVCNAYTSEKEWGYNRSRTIWHGFDPEEFYVGTRDKGVLSVKKVALEGRPHCRGYYTHHNIMRYLPEEMYPTHTSVESPEHLKSNLPAYSIEMFKRYRDTLGSYTVYLNTTVSSPMPRARGEAMVSGLATVNYDSYDISEIVKNGVDGFYSKDPEEMADILKHLYTRKTEARRIGNLGRKKSSEVLSISRYLSDWKKVIREEIGVKL